MYSRRDFTKIALITWPAAHACGGEINSKVDGVQLGIQSYSFRHMPLDGTISAMKEIGIGECELYMGHAEPQTLHGDALKQWRLTTPLSHFKDIRRKFDDAGI
jgi:sugar phosphate isomerase/epimerase